MKIIIPIPTKVPKGDFCVGNENHIICDHLDNEGGHPTCGCRFLFTGYASLEYDKKGRVPKHPQCLHLSHEKLSK